jgi:N-acetyl-1-D-myo-inositol-2-amino-2-deoxy-alpha-D-glucopyranoside deacetylase
MSTAPDRRLLLVHAHPDDESIDNGATMAKYAAEGARVTLVTCTLGEEGEVIPAELAHLAPAPSAPAEGPGTPEDPEDPYGLTPLGRHRRAELAAAMAELGVTDHRILGGAGRYRDSGMMGEPTNDRPGCFWQAPLDEAALRLVRVIRDVRPQVLVTYDPYGGYGHPDHIKAHRVAVRAARLAADAGAAPEAGEPHTIARIWFNCVPRTAVEDGFARLRRGGFRFPGVGEPGDVPGLVDDETSVDAVIDGSAYAGAKAAAMRAHATQIDVEGAFFALSNGLGQPLLATEHYRLADPLGTGAGRVREAERDGVITDLFAGTGA